MTIEVCKNISTRTGLYPNLKGKRIIQGAQPTCLSSCPSYRRNHRVTRVVSPRRIRGGPVSCAGAIGVLREAGDEVSDAEDVVPLFPPKLYLPVGLYPGGR